MYKNPTVVSTQINAMKSIKVGCFTWQVFFFSHTNICWPDLNIRHQFSYTALLCGVLK